MTTEQIGTKQVQVDESGTVVGKPWESLGHPISRWVRVEWAYPSSENANGFPNGCYCVERSTVNAIEQTAKTETLARGFPDVDEALGWIDSNLNIRLSMRHES